MDRSGLPITSIGDSRRRLLAYAMHKRLAHSRSLGGGLFEVDYFDLAHGQRELALIALQRNIFGGADVMREPTRAHIEL